MTLLRYMALFMTLILTGCGGYSFGGGNVSVLPPEFKTLAVGEVLNPTTLSWLEPRIRQLLRDELNNRGGIVWVDDKASADAVISIETIRYYRPSSVTGKDDETLRSSAIFKFKAMIRSNLDDSILWESDEIDQTWSFYSGDEQEADMEVTRLGIRRLADRMSQNY